MFLKVSQYSEENIFVGGMFLLMEPVFLFNSFIKKESSTQVFSCEYCKVFSNSFFYRTPPLAVFDQILNKDHEVYLDNYLTSIPPLQHLKIQRVRHNSCKQKS